MKILSLCAFLILSVSAFAQNTMYFMDALPQRNIYNPAHVSRLKFHIGLPVINTASAELYNSGFNFGELEDFMDDLESENFNPSQFVNSMGEKNNFISQARVNLASFGFGIREHSYFNFDIRLNNYLTVKSDPEIVYLLVDPDDIPVADFPVHIDDVEMLENNYLSMGFSYSRKINDHLTLGIRPVINFGGVGFQTYKIDYTITREETTRYYDDGSGRGEVIEYQEVEYDETFSGVAEIGMPVEINPDAIEDGILDLDEGIFPEDWQEDLQPKDYLKNPSFALDLGATYELDKWLFSASVLNIGGTVIKSNTYSFDGDQDEIRVEEKSQIKTGVPPQIFLGALRQFSPKWNYGLLFQNTFYESGSNASATLSLNGHVGSALSTSVSYTAGYKYDNLGLGLRLRFLPGTDLFMVTDNLIQAINYKKAYRATVAFGVNIAIGAKMEHGSDASME